MQGRLDKQENTPSDTEMAVGQAGRLCKARAAEQPALGHLMEEGFLGIMRGDAYQEGPI